MFEDYSLSKKIIVKEKEEPKEEDEDVGHDCSNILSFLNK